MLSSSLFDSITSPQSDALKHTLAGTVNQTEHKVTMKVSPI